QHLALDTRPRQPIGSVRLRQIGLCHGLMLELGGGGLIPTRRRCGVLRLGKWVWRDERRLLGGIPHLIRDICVLMLSVYTRRLHIQPSPPRPIRGSRRRFQIVSRVLVWILLHAGTSPVAASSSDVAKIFVRQSAKLPVWGVAAKLLTQRAHGLL